MQRHEHRYISARCSSHGQVHVYPLLFNLMGINFTGMNAVPATSGESQAAPAVAPPAPAGATLDLGKNVTLDITKRNPGLKKITVAAGWDVATAGSSFDLDIIAIPCNENGKITGMPDIVYFNNKQIPGIKLNGDNLTGEGEGDDETISIDLTAISPKTNSVVFAVVIFDAVNKRQTFGMIKESYVRVINDDTGSELCHFILKDDYSTDTAVVFAKIERNGNDWDFVTIGEGKQADINGVLALYQ